MFAAIELTWGMVGAVLTGLGVGGAGIGYAMFKARRMYLKLEDHQGQAKVKNDEAETEHRGSFWSFWEVRGSGIMLPVGSGPVPGLVCGPHSEFGRLYV